MSIADSSLTRGYGFGKQNAYRYPNRQGMAHELLATKYAVIKDALYGSPSLLPPTPA
jgi:hypothetical protein